MTEAHALQRNATYFSRNRAQASIEVARWLMWGRLSACGGLSTRLGDICMGPARPIENRPQVKKPPHK